LAAKHAQKKKKIEEAGRRREERGDYGFDVGSRAGVKVFAGFKSQPQRRRKEGMKQAFTTVGKKSNREKRDTIVKNPRGKEGHPR